MASKVTVTAELRASRGKNEARRTRVAGRIPAVVYGAFKDPVSISVDPRAISAIIRSASGYNTIFDIEIPGQDTAPAMLVDHQNDPVKGTLLHADLKRIDLSKRIKVSVPVLTTGEPKGVKIQGGLLELVNRTLEIECLPNEIPDSFTVDVAELNLGQSIRASDVPLPGSVRLLSAPDSVLAHVVALRAEAEPTPAATEAAAPATPEPEVVKKGKKEEEAADDKAKKK